MDKLTQYILNEIKSLEPLIELEPKQVETMLGREYKTFVKTFEMALIQKAKKFSNAKPRFVLLKHFLIIGYGREKPGISIHGQLQLDNGWLDSSIFIPIKFGSFKMRAIEAGGRF